MIATLLQDAPAPSLSLGGWVFMIASNLFVWGFAFWCIVRVLRAPLDDVPDPVRDFHSA